MTTQIVEFPINGNVALAGKSILAAGQAADRARSTEQRSGTKRRRRRTNTQFYFTAALSLLIVMGLFFAFAFRSAPEQTKAPDAPPPATTAESGTSLPTITSQPPAEEAASEYIPDAAEVEALAKLIFGEAGVVPSTTEKAAVVWCVLNRVDDPRFPDTVLEVITAPAQFNGYAVDYPVYERYAELAADVLKRYHAERAGEENVGRVLPADYCFFTGDGKHNHFTNEWQSGNTWGWTLESPYDD